MTVLTIIMTALTAVLPIVGIVGLALFGRWLWQHRAEMDI